MRKKEKNLSCKVLISDNFLNYAFCREYKSASYFFNRNKNLKKLIFSEKKQGLSGHPWSDKYEKYVNSILTLKIDYDADTEKKDDGCYENDDHEERKSAVETSFASRGLVSDYLNARRFT